jgi:hypothetical protein
MQAVAFGGGLAVCLHNGGVDLVADDLGAWLIGLLADAGRRKLVSFVLGDEQERALHRACQAALTATAAELRPGDAAAADEVAMVVGGGVRCACTAACR